MSDSDKLKVVFKAFLLACECLKRASIEINDQIDIDFMQAKLHGEIPSYFLVQAEQELNLHIASFKEQSE